MEVTAEWFQFIQDDIAVGHNIIALQDLADMMTERLEQYGNRVNRTHLKKTVLKTVDTRGNLVQISQ